MPSIGKLKKLITKRNAVSVVDPNQQKNDLAKKVKLSNRQPLHGYNPGQDERVYESLIHKHRVSVTVSDPHDPLVSKRKEKIQKFCKVHASDENEAKERAHHFYVKKKYKVHEVNYVKRLDEIVACRDDFNKKHDDKLDKEKIKHIRKLGPQKQPDFSKMKRVQEGYYSEKDIARQEAEYAKKHNPKSIMMDKIADMHKKGKLTPEAKKIALNQMKKMQSESVDFLFENWDIFQDYSQEELFEALEKHQIAAQKAFKHNMKGRPLKNGEFTYLGTKEFPVGPSRYLDPAAAERDNKYDANGKFINRSKKKGILSRLLRKEEREINEGIVRDVSRYFLQNRIKNKLIDRLEKQQRPHNKKITNAGVVLRHIKKLQDLKIKNNQEYQYLQKKGSDIADSVQTSLKRSSQLGRRMSALKPDKSGNSFVKEWPKTPNELKYLSGQSRIGNRKPIHIAGKTIKEESLDEGLTQKIRKYSGIQKHSLLKKLDKATSGDKDGGLNRWSQNNGRYVNVSGMASKRTKLHYLTGRGLKPHEKSLKRFGDPSKSGDENWK